MTPPRRARPAFYTVLVLTAAALSGCLFTNPSQGAGHAPDAPNVAVHGPNRTLAPGEAATFTAAVDAPGGAALYEWRFGDGARDVGRNLTAVTHAFAAPGLHVVTLTVTDARGSAGSGSVAVGVAHVATFNGRVTAGVGGGDAFTERVPVEPDASGLTATLRLEPAEGSLDGRVRVRIVAPGNGSAPPRAVYDQEVAAPGGGANHTLAVAAGDLAQPGTYRLEVTPVEGSVRVDGRARVAYG